MLRYFFCLAVAAMLMLTGGCSPNTSPAEEVSSAKQALTEKRWPDAIIHLKNALRDNNENTAVLNGEIRFLMGQAQLGRGDMQQASRFFAQAVEERYQLESSIPAYALALFRQGEYDTLTDFIVNSRGKLPQVEVELALYEILVLHKTGKAQQASIKLAVLSDEAVNSTLGLFTQAYTQASESPDNALTLIDLLLTQDAGYIDAYLLKGQLLFSQKHFEQAYQAFEHYLTLQPKAGHIHFLLAMSALQQSKRELVQKHVTSLLSLSPNHPLANHLQALLYFEKKEFQQAKESSEKSLQFGLASPINYLIAGLSAITLGQDEQAYHHLQKAANGMPDNQQVKRVLAQVQLKLGYLQDAAESFASLNVDDDGSFSLGNMIAAQLVGNQQHQDAQTILSKLEFAPVANPMLKVKQGILQLQAGDKQGLAIIEQVAISENSSTMANIAYIMALADAGDLLTALEQAVSWQEKDPNNVNAMNVLALLSQKNGQGEDEAKWYKKALAADDKNVPAILYYAYEAAKKGNNDDAREHFFNVLSIVPNHSRAFAGLLRLSLQVDSTPNWLEIQSALQLDKPHDSALKMLVEAMFQRQNYQELVDFLSTKSDQHAWPKSVWNIWLQTQTLLNNKTLPQTVMQAYLQKFSNVQSQLFVISLLEKQQQYERILELIENSGKIGRMSIELKYARANALLSLKKVEQAEFLISQLAKDDPLEALGWLQGQLALLVGDVAKGKQQLEAYFSKQPTLPGLMQLAHWALENQDNQKVVTLGEQYLVNFPNDIDARALLSNWLMKRDPVAALKFIDVPQAHDFIVRHWQVANNVAWLQLQSEDKQRALVFSERAYKQQPENNQVALTHAMSLLQHGDKKHVLIVLNKIKSPNVEVINFINELSTKD